MPLTTTVGQVAVVKLTMGSGGATDWVGPGINWKLDLDGKVVDKSNFRDGRIKNGTLPDGTLTMTLVFDASDAFYKATTGNATLNSTGSAKVYMDATHFWVVPVILSNIGASNPGVEDDVMVDVTFGLNGSITYPVAP